MPARSPYPLPHARETVLLFHGLGRTALSMRRMAAALRTAGYRVRSASYPSTRHPIERLAREVVAPRVREALDEQPDALHFVTHSLGGILVRYYAAHVGIPDGLRSRAVTIAPPHAGSEAADRLVRVLPVRWWCGPTLAELGTGGRSVPGGLGPVQGLDVGVIAGDWSPIPGGGRLFGGPSDGLVAVERARVEGMADFLVVHRGHTFIAGAPEVRAQTIHFLRHGRFDHAEAAPANPAERVRLDAR